MVLTYLQLCQSSKARQMLVSRGIRIDPAKWERAKQAWVLAAETLGVPAAALALYTTYLSVMIDTGEYDTVIRLEG